MDKKMSSDKTKLLQVGSNPATTILMVESLDSGANIPADSVGPLAGIEKILEEQASGDIHGSKTHKARRRETRRKEDSSRYRWNSDPNIGEPGKFAECQKS